MKEAIFAILGLAAGVIAYVMAWTLIISRPLRIDFMTALPDPPRGMIASLSATLWLFPAMFGLGCIRNVMLAFHGHPTAVNILLATVEVLAAIHLSISALQLARVVRRARMG